MLLQRDVDGAVHDAIANCMQIDAIFMLHRGKKVPRILIGRPENAPAKVLDLPQADLPLVRMRKGNLKNALLSAFCSRFAPALDIDAFGDPIGARLHSTSYSGLPKLHVYVPVIVPSKTVLHCIATENEFTNMCWYDLSDVLLPGYLSALRSEKAAAHLEAMNILLEMKEYPFEELLAAA